MDTRANESGQTFYYIGIDQHKEYSQVAVIDQDGCRLAEQKLYHDEKDKMIEFFKQFPSESTSIALEATGSWYWLYDLLESLHLKVKLAHPLKVKLIAESTIKTDKIDACVLANLLRTGYLPTAYIPNKEVRALRERLRHRIVIVHQRTAIKNRISAVLAKLGINRPEEFSSRYTTELKEWLRNLDLSEPYQSEINNYLKIIEELTGLVKTLDEEIQKYLKKDARAEYLMSIPGIGQFTAYLILAEIGEIERFGSAKKLCSYAGLVPSVNQSGQHMYFGHITKQGDVYLRFGLTESSHIAVRRDEYFKKRYQKLKATKGSGKAIVAVARELLEIVYWVLKEKRHYYAFHSRPRRRELMRVTG
jgi:transposase